MFHPKILWYPGILIDFVKSIFSFGLIVAISCQKKLLLIDANEIKEKKVSQLAI